MPSGLQQTKPMPSSSHSGSTWASGPRHSIEYSFWMTARGCTAWARRTVCRPGSDRPNCRTLPCVDQFLHRAGNILDGHVRVDTVLVQHVDAVGAQAPQLGIDHLADVLGPAVAATGPRCPVT